MAREAALGEKAGDETRTRDIFLGKEVLYQLSYTRTKNRRCLSCLPLERFQVLFRPALEGEMCKLRKTRPVLK